jgi:hypothetical protein
MERRTFMLALLVLAGCATSSGPSATEPGVREVSRYALVHEGPELVASLGYFQATQSIGEEWLVLAVELTSASRGGRSIVNRSDIFVISPDGRRIPLVSQQTYREQYAKYRVTVERALRGLPILGRYDEAQMACDRWFLAGPFAGFDYQEVYVNTFNICDGPLVFAVPGGIQPGRWRLIIELEESRVDIPFELYADE